MHDITLLETELGAIINNGSGGSIFGSEQNYQYTFNALFPTAPITSMIYVGTVGRTSRYVGTKQNEEIYLGTGTLF